MRSSHSPLSPVNLKWTINQSKAIVFDFPVLTAPTVSRIVKLWQFETCNTGSVIGRD